MVQPVNIAKKAEEPLKKNPRVVEIIGPAGAGKTTLYKALSNYPEKIRLESFPDVRKATDAPFFIRNGLRLIPELFRLCGLFNPQLSRREFAWMSILYGWPAILQNHIQQNPQVIVLDQGPVYLFAEMREFGPEYLKAEKAGNFWNKISCRWATTLDMIVWLDAADNTLLERIRNRTKEHAIKGKPSAIAVEFLDRYRGAFDTIISKLQTNANGLRILRLDTGRGRPGEIVDRLLVELGIS
jgi:hypothetical protein